MQERTPAEVGELLRRRRETLGLTQHTVPNVSSATVGKIERAAADRFRSATLTSYLHALGLEVDAWDRLLAGTSLDSVTAPDRPAPAESLAARLEAIEKRLAALEQPGPPLVSGSGLRLLPAHEDPDEFPEAAHEPGGEGDPQRGAGGWARPPVGATPAEDGEAIDEGVDPPAPDDFDQGEPGDGA